MKNCLVTKLKGTVDNNNLLKLGVLSFNIDTVEDSTNSKYFAYYPGDGITVTTLDGLTFQQGNNAVYLTAGTSGTLELKPKYNLTSITVNQQLTKLNIEQFKGTSLVSFSLNFATIGLDLDGFLKAVPSIKTISAPNCPQEGETPNLALYPTLETVRMLLASSNISWNTNGLSSTPTLKIAYGNFGNTLSSFLIDMANKEASMSEYVLKGVLTNSEEELAAINVLKSRLSNFWINNTNMKA